MNGYEMPKGMYQIPHHLLDLREDAAVDQVILSPPPVTHQKNIWFYWNQGYAKMHPYSQRTVRAWHRRFSRFGWVIRVVDREPGSVSDISAFLDTSDPTIFPKAFIEGTLCGRYATQHYSDLVRFPLLLTYGGIYTDVGFMQIGDIDRLWNETVGNKDSPYDVLSYNGGGEADYVLMNYFLATTKNNPLFERFHRLLLALWAADGGKLETTGMCNSPLLQGVPLIGDGQEWEDEGRKYAGLETNQILSDYIIQGQAMKMVMGLVDLDDGWNGPEYTVNHVYAIEFMEGSQLINDLTKWNGVEAFRLMSLQLPANGASEDVDQANARNIVEQCLSRSFGFKLAHGLILRVLGETLGSLWRKHEGSDNIPGTYAHWLRYGMLYWTQLDLPPRVEYLKIEPMRVGSLIAT